MEGKEVICINDNWGLDDPAPSFMDKDIVTAVSSSGDMVYYQLKDRFDVTARFPADHFVVSGEQNEEDIMPRDQVREHIKQMYARKKESDRRIKGTILFLAAASVIAVASSIYLLKSK